MYFPSRHYTEKRRHVRMLVNCPMIYGPAGTSERHKGLCRNLSVSGILFQADEELAPGAELNVVVKPALAVSRPLLALVRVLRVEPAEAENGFQVAATITRVVG